MLTTQISPKGDFCFHGIMSTMNMVFKYKTRQPKTVYKQKRDDKRLVVLQYYSKNLKPFCSCCGESEVKFLSIDHINGGGTKHRKQSKIGTISTWLIKNNFPTGFQVLCHNCNMAKGLYGECPHKNSW